MKKGNVPKTSQVSPETVLKVLDNSRAKGEDIIYIALTSKVSGTVNVAEAIVNEYLLNYPDMKITVIDSEGGAGGGALLTLQALEMAKQGMDYETIVSITQESTKHIHYHFTLDNLKWLVKSGRLPKVAGATGDALSIKPYLSINDTGIYLKRLVRGKDRIYKRIVQDVQKGVGDFTDQLIGISHVNDLENAQKLENLIKDALFEATVQIFEVGALLSAHLGLGGVGVFYYDSKPETYMYLNS
ncbi:DegV family protein [Alkalibacterium iburiense]|uniref:DegV family protein n=1 Tax=Alkalibacterium iburiense TaxID=290589 RepID=A0ABN0X489_9LACT